GAGGGEPECVQPGRTGDERVGERDRQPGEAAGRRGCPLRLRDQRGRCGRVRCAAGVADLERVDVVGYAAVAVQSEHGRLVAASGGQLALVVPEDRVERLGGAAGGGAGEGCGCGRDRRGDGERPGQRHQQEFEV